MTFAHFSPSDRESEPDQTQCDCGRTDDHRCDTPDPEDEPTAREHWRPVRDFEHLYEVSDLGRIRTILTGKVRTLMARHDGYQACTLSRDGKSYTRPIHRLVLEAFVGPRPPGMECRHLDGDPMNNRLVNIVWGTPYENHEDRQRHGTVLRGAALKQTKLTEAQARSVRFWISIGITRVSIGMDLGLTPQSIGKVFNGKHWRHLDVSQESYGFAVVCKVCDGAGTIRYRTVPSNMDIPCPCTDSLARGQLEDRETPASGAGQQGSAASGDPAQSVNVVTNRSDALTGCKPGRRAAVQAPAWLGGQEVDDVRRHDGCDSVAPADGGTGQSFEPYSYAVRRVFQRAQDYLEENPVADGWPEPPMSEMLAEAILFWEAP